MQLRLSVVFACCVILAACGDADTAGPASTSSPTPPSGQTLTASSSASASATAAPNFARETIQVVTSAGRTIDVRVEVPTTESAFQQGLMGRPPLPDGEGMLFLMAKRGVCAFWMKDTPSPLSVGFADSSGRITEVRDMAPFSLEIIQPPQGCAYALEVSQGWFARQGIAAGDSFRFPWPYESPPPYPTN